MSADDLVQLCCDVMSDLLDRHCPVVTACSRARTMTPWFDADCRAARRRAKAAERRYRLRLRRRRCSDADRQDWKAKLKEMHSVYEGKKVNYWNDEIATSQGDTRRLWRTLHRALLVRGLMARPGTLLLLSNVEGRMSCSSRCCYRKYLIWFLSVCLSLCHSRNTSVKFKIRKYLFFFTERYNNLFRSFIAKIRGRGSRVHSEWRRQNGVPSSRK